MAEDCRVAAARVLDAVIRGGSSLEEPLASHLAKVDPRDRALLQQICFGTLRQYFRLQGMLGQALKKPLKARDGVKWFVLPWITSQHTSVRSLVSLTTLSAHVLPRLQRAGTALTYTPPRCTRKSHREGLTS